MMLHTSLVTVIISIIFVVVRSDENSAKCDALSWL